jgi:phosphoribosylformylglycinamidine synthase
MVGELPDPARVAGSALVADGDAIGLVGPFSPTPAGSELAKLRGELDSGLPTPEVDAVAAACAVVRYAVREGRLASAHDISDGGLACAVAESAIAGGVGCRIDLQPLRERGCSPEEALFGEGAGGFLVSGERAALEEIGATLIGEAGGSAIEIAAGDRSLAVSLGDAESAWRSSLPDRLKRSS